MRGLRTQEGKKFENFFEIVQQIAEKHRKVFFLDAGLGKELKTDEYSGENLQGWLIPKEKVNDFEKVFMNFQETEEWDDFFAFFEWEEKDGKIEMFFEEYEDSEIPKILK